VDMAYKQGAYRSWKVMEFKIQIFHAWKVLELGVGPGKSSWKINQMVAGSLTHVHVSALTYIILLSTVRLDSICCLV